MGADIYLDSVFEPHHAKWQPIFDDACRRRDAAKQSGNERLARSIQEKDVEPAYEHLHEKGYFRDSYNASDLLWTMDLSWWTDVGDRLDEKGILPVKECQWLMDTLYKRFPSVDWGRWYESQKSDLDPEEELSGWVEFFKGEFEALTALLRQAIDLDEGLRCSI